VILFAGLARTASERTAAGTYVLQYAHNDGCASIHLRGTVHTKAGFLSGLFPPKVYSLKASAYRPPPLVVPELRELPSEED